MSTKRDLFQTRERCVEKRGATWQNPHVPSQSGVRYGGSRLFLMSPSTAWHRQLQMSHSPSFVFFFISPPGALPSIHPLLDSSRGLGLLHSLLLDGEAIQMHSPLMIPAASNINGAFRNASPQSSSFLQLVTALGVIVGEQSSTLQGSDQITP